MTVTFTSQVVIAMLLLSGRRRDGANVGQRARKVRDAAGGVPQGADRLREEDQEGL